MSLNDHQSSGMALPAPPESTHFRVPEQPEVTEEPPHDSRHRSDAEQDKLEATELTRIKTNYKRATSLHHAKTTSVSKKPHTTLARVKHSISSFWKHQISITVDHVCCRDHLALERTFLAYLRTSLVISMIGIVVAQLFRIQHAPNTNPIFGFYVLGKPLAIICQGVAIYSLLLGAFRTWRIQHALVRGKTIAGGYELILLGLGIAIMVVTFFVLMVAVDISKEV